MFSLMSGIYFTFAPISGSDFTEFKPIFYTTLILSFLIGVLVAINTPARISFFERIVKCLTIVMGAFFAMFLTFLFRAFLVPIAIAVVLFSMINPSGEQHSVQEHKSNIRNLNLGYLCASLMALLVFFTCPIVKDNELEKLFRLFGGEEDNANRLEAMTQSLSWYISLAQSESSYENAQFAKGLAEWILKGMIYLPLATAVLGLFLPKKETATKFFSVIILLPPLVLWWIFIQIAIVHEANPAEGLPFYNVGFYLYLVFVLVAARMAICRSHQADLLLHAEVEEEARPKEVKHEEQPQPEVSEVSSAESNDDK
jgi:hypothetical protein